MKKKNTLNSDETPHQYRIKLRDEELELFKKYKVKKILEIFSGDGTNLVGLTKLGYNLIGIESEENHYKKSLGLIKKNKVAITVINHPIFYKKLPFNSSIFDCVYSYQYINHNFKDRILFVFKEAHRVLKKGGLFSIKISDIEQVNFKKIYGDIYKEQDHEFPQIQYRKLANQTFAKLEKEEMWIPHYGFYEKELLLELKKIGFKPLNFRKIRWNIVANFEK
jgi:SAM-dependent methyltransferase